MVTIANYKPAGRTESAKEMSLLNMHRRVDAPATLRVGLELSYASVE
jgi:hypothetical protein